MTAGAFATAGLRGEDRMEDGHAIQQLVAGSTSCHLLAVFDGHRGPQAADYAAQHMAQQLQARLTAAHPAEALVDAFVSIDQSFRYALAQMMVCL